MLSKSITSPKHFKYLESFNFPNMSRYVGIMWFLVSGTVSLVLGLVSLVLALVLSLVLGLVSIVLGLVSLV